MKSATRGYIDHGDAYLATLGPSLLLDYYRREDNSTPKPGNPVRGFAPNWMGQFYARYQWETGQSSGDIVDVITPEWLQIAYHGLHDLDMRLAVEKVSREVVSVRDVAGVIPPDVDVEKMRREHVTEKYL